MLFNILGVFIVISFVCNVLLANFDDYSDEDYERLIQTGPCTIDVVDETISQEEFVNKYAYSKPVIFKSRKDTSRNKVFTQKSKLENLVRDFGEKDVIVATANTYSYKKHQMKFYKYIERYVLNKTPLSKLGNETLYLFGDFDLTQWRSLMDHYEPPKNFVPFHEPAYSFGVAAVGTGVPFHFHGPVFAETIHGQKRWFLYEPDRRPDFDPDKSTLQWFIEDYQRMTDKSDLYECILEPLDVIYFPDRWWHATLNVDTVVFISTFLSKMINDEL